MILAYFVRNVRRQNVKEWLHNTSIHKSTLMTRFYQQNTHHNFDHHAPVGAGEAASAKGVHEL